MIRPDTCVDCAKPCPDLVGEDTSIFSRATGWRLILRKDEGGKHVPEWRCQDCWAKYRAAGGNVRPR